ncbi:MAG: radical SAM protein [Candidatus Methanomethylicia archaeon]|nr:radical SAM protein [Candidatus Methanomethylicia archaeon]
MESKSAVQLFKSVIDAPGMKTVLGGLTSYCESCGRSRLEVALELYVGLRESACFRCRLAERTVAALLSIGSSTFGASSKEIKEKFRDPYWRRGLANVIKGLAYFGVQKPFVPGAPFQVVWNITSRCNLKCKHCYANAGTSGNAAAEMGTEDAKATIDKLSRWGVAVLAFSGGEPLIRKDILELAKYASSSGIYVAVATNGVLLSKEMCKSLRGAGVEYLQISLDGATASTHDQFRGVPGMFSRTIDGIKNAVEEGFFVNVATTATKGNLKEIPAIIDLCGTLGVDWFMMYNFVPTGRGKFIEENDLSPYEREALLKLLWDRLKERKGVKPNVLSTAPQFARVALEAEGAKCSVIPTHFSNNELNGALASLSDFIGGCGAGRFYIAIEQDGTITPCVFLPLPLGNILRDDPEELWRGLKAFRELRERDSLKSHCGNCEFRYVCGGCRARAYAYFGDYSEHDPGCVLNASTQSAAGVRTEALNKV